MVVNQRYGYTYRYIDLTMYISFFFFFEMSIYIFLNIWGRGSSCSKTHKTYNFNLVLPGIYAFMKDEFYNQLYYYIYVFTSSKII